jgi:hypothetical protein
VELDHPPSSGSDGYSGAAVAGAVLATIFFPFIALIAALLLQGGQHDPQRKSQLRRWAWVSGLWLVFSVVVWVVLATVTL